MMDISVLFTRIFFLEGPLDGLAAFDMQPLSHVFKFTDTLASIARFFLTCETNTNITWSTLEWGKLCNLCLAEVRISQPFRWQTPIIEQSGLKWCQHAATSGILVLWAFTKKECPCFFVPVYSISFSWISHFCIRFFVDVLDTLTVNWGGEKASPSSFSRLPPNQNLKQHW